MIQKPTAKWSVAFASALLLGLVPGALLGLAAPSDQAQNRGLDCATFPGAEAYVSRIDNPHLPLPPGATFVYEGTEDGEVQGNVIEVTRDTKVILGVRTTVIRDTVTDAQGELIEQTLDWLAQDKAGNVWYFGEDSKDYKNGQVVSTKGSWEAGVKGAKPGILMPGRPRVGQTYRQECAPGVALDTARILDLATPATVPFGSFDTLLTREWNPLQRGSAEQKFYAPCVGLVRVVKVKGGTGETVLVDAKGLRERGGAGCTVTPGRGAEAATKSRRAN